LDQKIRKKEFIQTYVANLFSENRLSNSGLADALGITERHYYNLRSKYAKDLNEAASQARASIRLSAFAAIQKKLSGADVGNEVIELALTMTGDLGRNNQVIVAPGAGEGKATTVVNIGTMDATELERLVDSRLQATRAKNIRKSQRKT